ncbi:MAG: ABC transporter permease [Thermoguttaceae bacterium]|nr:ABC transporter permease [Thermoguttaceae bacterium]
MRSLLNGFNMLYVRELKRALVASGIIALLVVAFAYASLASFWIPPWPADDLGETYRAFWPWFAPISIFLSSPVLPVYVFAVERKKDGFKVLQRFPVATATVYLAKLSAILTAFAAICVFFAVSSFAFDVYYGDVLSTTLRAPFEDDVPNLGQLNLALSLLFASLELFCWSAFWAPRVRRSTLAVLATGASAFVGWALTGFVVGIAALSLNPELAAKLPHTPVFFAAFFGMIHGFSAGTALAGVGLFRFGFVRLGFLAIPLCGIYRQCRRQGAATAFNLPS